MPRRFRHGILGALLLGVVACSSHGTGNGSEDLGTTHKVDSGVPWVPTGPPVSGTILSLVAGGIRGTDNSDGTDPSVRFKWACGMALDGAGTMYVSTCAGDSVWKIVPRTGEVTPVAGSREQYGSADGIGADARFHNPRGVAADGAGNLYVADSTNHTIRKISLASGGVSTLAGAAGVSGRGDGPASVARFQYPRGLLADGAGNLYVTEAGSFSVRRIDLATGTVSTLAGDPKNYGGSDGVGEAARFSMLGGMAADRSGNLYVADGVAVRKIVIATRTVSTLAGSPGYAGGVDGIGAAARFKKLDDLVFDGTSSLLVADSGNSLIRRITIATGAVSTLAGTVGQPRSDDGIGAAARFDEPALLSTDGTSLYVGEPVLIRKVELGTSAVTTMAGSLSLAMKSVDGTGAAARFFTASAMAADRDGNVYVADSGNHTIRKVVLATGVTTTIAGQVGIAGSADGSGTEAQLNRPSGVAVDDAGSLYIADSQNSTIRKLDLATGAVSVLAGSVGTRSYADGVGGWARFSSPTALTLDRRGNLFVADFGNKVLRKIDLATRSVTTVIDPSGVSGSAGESGSAVPFKSSSVMTVDPAGNLWIMEGSVLRKLVLATGTVTSLVDLAKDVSSPAGLVMDGAGTLFISAWAGSAVRKIDLSTVTVSRFVGDPITPGIILGPLPAALKNPSALAVAPGGVLVILDVGENVVLAVR